MVIFDVIILDILSKIKDRSKYLIAHSEHHCTIIQVFQDLDLASFFTKQRHIIKVFQVKVMGTRSDMKQTMLRILLMKTQNINIEKLRDADSQYLTWPIQRTISGNLWPDEQCSNIVFNTANFLVYISVRDTTFRSKILVSFSLQQGEYGI